MMRTTMIAVLIALLLLALTPVAGAQEGSVDPADVDCGVSVDWGMVPSDYDAAALINGLPDDVRFCMADNAQLPELPGYTYFEDHTVLGVG